MLDNAASLGITHAERELGLQPRTFARKKAISKMIDKAIDDYSQSRAFFITGVAKQEILDAAKNYILNWTKTHLDLIPDQSLIDGLAELLKDWLPEGTNVAARSATIARTNVSDLYNFARFSVFDSPAMREWVTAFQYSAIMDGRTTELCRGLHGRIFTREDLIQTGLIPPNHFNCRSTLLPVTRLDLKSWPEQWLRQKPLAEDLLPQKGF